MACNKHNTPGIIKYPFWHRVYTNPQATYLCINLGESYAPVEIRNRSISIDADIDALLGEALSVRQTQKA